MLETGRLFSASKPFAVELGLHGPIAGLQGGVIYDVDSGALLHAQPLSATVAAAAYDALIQKDFHLQLYFGDTLYLDHTSPASDEYIRLSRVEPVMVPDLRVLLEGKPPQGALMKLLAIGVPDLVASEIPVLARRLGHEANVFRSLPQYLGGHRSRSGQGSRARPYRGHLGCGSRGVRGDRRFRQRRSDVQGRGRRASRSRTRPRPTKMQRPGSSRNAGPVWQKR